MLIQTMTEISREQENTIDKIRRLEEVLAEKDIEVEALRKLGQAIGSTFDIERMLEVVADIAVQVTKTDTCFIYLLDDVGQELILRAAKGPTKGAVGKIKLKIGEGVTGWVAKERQHVALATAFQRHWPGRICSVAGICVSTNAISSCAIRSRISGPKNRGKFRSKNCAIDASSKRL